MWLLTGLSEPKSSAPLRFSPLIRIGGDTTLAPIAAVSFAPESPLSAGSNTVTTVTSTVVPLTPTPITIAVESPTGSVPTTVSVITISVPPGTTSVSSIALPSAIGSSSGFTWTPAKNVDVNPDGTLTFHPLREEPPVDLFMGVTTPTTFKPAPTAGTFVFNPITQKITVFVSPTTQPIVASGVSVPLQIVSQILRVETAGALPAIPTERTNRVMDGLPSLFTKFPLSGAVRISLSFESAPSGSFAFEIPANYRSSIECNMKPGRVVSLYGIDLRISSLSIEQQSLDDYPTGMLIVSAGLGAYYDERLSMPVPYLGVSGGGIMRNVTQQEINEQDYDPDCGLPPEPGGATSLARAMNSPAFTNAALETQLSKRNLDDYPSGYTSASFDELAALFSTFSDLGVGLYNDRNIAARQKRELESFRSGPLGLVPDAALRGRVETQSRVLIDLIGKRLEVLNNSQIELKALAAEYSLQAAATRIAQTTGGTNVSSQYSAAGGKRGARKYISLSELARKANISYQGPGLQIPIPENATARDSTSVGSYIQEAMRIAGMFADYNTRSIRGVSWTGTRSYSYTDIDIYGTVKTDIQAKDELTDAGLDGDYILPAPDLDSPFPIAPTTGASVGLVTENQGCIPYGAKYCRVRLTGEFLNIEQAAQEKAEKTRFKKREESPPRWKEVPLIEVIISGGDSNPGNPPAVFPESEDGVPDISVIGQQTKTVTWAKMRGGLPIYEETEVWGFEGYLDSYMLWVVIQQTQTYHTYDSKTGYYLGWDKYGWVSVQLVSESPGDQLRDTRYLEKGGYTGQWRKLIQFTQAPMQGAERYFLATHSLYYGSIDQPPMIPYKICGMNGKSITKYAPDPNYVEPAFAEITTRVEQGYIEASHPDNTTANPLPPFSSGVDIQFRQNITIDTAVGVGYRGYKDRPGFTGYTFGNPLKPDTYTTYTAEEQSQGTQFEKFARNNRFQDSVGRPGTHTRIAKQFTRAPDPAEEEEDPDKSDRQKQKATYSYFLESPGCPVHSKVEGGSKSYAYARTLAEAKRAAQTDLWIDDFRGALSTSFEVAFDPNVRPGDLIQLTFAGTQMSRRVSGVEWSLTLHGWVDGVPFVTADPMSIRTGINRQGGPMATVRREKDPIDPNANTSKTPGMGMDDEDDKPPSNKNDKFSMGSVLPVTVFNNSRY